MVVTATELRKNIYKLLDEVLETGKPLEIERNGRKLKISTEKPKSKLDNLKKRNVMVEDPEYYVHLDWSKEWKPFI